MDCRDRFAVWLVELVLEPVRALRENGGGATTVRTALGERRFDVTVSRAGEEYRWELHEVGGPLVAAGPEGLSDPEDAFWDAWASIEATA
jgi:hypothetical protein